MQVGAVVLDSADPRALAAFYQRLLGWTMVANEPALPGFPEEDGWVMLRSPAGDAGLSTLSFQYEPEYRPPVWPRATGDQGMMLHLDIAVENLEEGTAWAVQAGATEAGYQPQDQVRVMLDPAGHPFCLFPAPI